MPVATGQIKKETTFTEILPADQNPAKRQKRTPIWDFLPTIATQDWNAVTGKYEINLYRYNPQTEKRMAVEKIFECIDVFWVQRKYGGGNFNVLVKEDGQLIYNEDFFIEGEPIIAGAMNGSHPTITAPGGSDSVAIQAMRMMMTPEMMRGMFDMFKMASTESMAMIRAQMPAPIDPLQTLRNAKEILGVGGPAAPNPMDDMFKQFMVAAIQKMLNPPETNAFKDTLALIGEIRGSGLLGGPAKIDLASSFVSTLPSLLDKAVNGLHEYRLQSEANERVLRLQHGEIRPNDPGVITMDPQPPSPANPATAASPTTQPPQTQSAPAAAAAVSPEVQQQVIIQYTLNRMVAAIRQPNSTGEDMYGFLLNTWPEMLDELTQFNKDALLMFFKSPEMQMQRLGNSILFQVANDPRLPKLLDEFFAAAAEAKKHAGGTQPPL